MRIGILGSKRLGNFDRLKEGLDKTIEKDDVLVTIKSKGIGNLLEMYSKLKKFNLRTYKTIGEVIVDSDYFIAFWDGRDQDVLKLIRKCESSGKSLIKIHLEDE